MIMMMIITMMLTMVLQYQDNNDNGDDIDDNNNDVNNGVTVPGREGVLREGLRSVRPHTQLNISLHKVNTHWPLGHRHRKTETDHPQHISSLLSYE